MSDQPHHQLRHKIKAARAATDTDHRKDPPAMSDYMGQADDDRPLFSMDDYNALSTEERHALSAWIQEQGFAGKRITAIEAVAENEDGGSWSVAVILGGRPEADVTREVLIATSPPPIPER